MKKLMTLVIVSLLSFSANASLLSALTKPLIKILTPTTLKGTAVVIPTIIGAKIANQDISKSDLERAGSGSLIVVLTTVALVPYVAFKTFEALGDSLSFEDKKERIKMAWIGTAEGKAGNTYTFGVFDSYFGCRDEADYKTEWECTKVSVFK